jgi:hypothetical protein
VDPHLLVGVADEADLNQGDQQAEEEEQPEDKGRREREKVQTCG